MTTELEFLTWAVVLGLIYVFLAAGLGTYQRGLKWNVSNRDGELTPLTGAAARASRANRNFLETFPFFAATALAVTLAHVSTPKTGLGAEIYFWARVAYLPIYVIGIPYLRTLVWAASLWGLLQLVEALL